MRPVDQILRSCEEMVSAAVGPWDAFCWTVVQPSLDPDELGARIGSNATWIAPVDLAEFAQTHAPAESPKTDSAVWVVFLDGAVGLLEDNGFAGSRTANLESLSASGSVRVVSFYWNEAIARSTLSEASGGVVQQYDILDDYEDLDDVPRLRDAITSVRSARMRENTAAAEGLAMVELMTDVQLTPEILARSCPALLFRSHPERPKRSREEEDLANLTAEFTAATPAQRDEALIFIMERVISVTGLAGEPAAARVPERMRRGEEMQRSHDELSYLGVRLQDEAPPVPRSGKIDLHNLGWRRLQAGAALMSALRQPRLAMIEAEHGPLYHAMWALDDQWPSTRAEAVRILRRG